MAYKTNEISIFDDYATIRFYNSDNMAMIDIEDVDKVSKYCFYLDNKGYARARKGNDKIFLHHLIMGKPNRGLVIDHINRNPLDNRKCNLRIATRSLNSINSKLAKNNTTGVRNVHIDKNTGKYRARIKRNGKMIHIGMYETLEEAKKAVEPYNIEELLK